MTHYTVAVTILTCVPWLVDMFAMTHAHVCHDSWMRVSWRITVQLRAQGNARPFATIHWHLCYDSLIRGIWLIDVCVMSHSYWSVCHESSMCGTCVPWLIDMWDMTQWCVCHESFICAPWLVDVCAIMHWNAFHDSMRLSQCVCHDWWVCVCHNWGIFCAMMPWYACHDSFMCGLWNITIVLCARGTARPYATTHWSVCHDSSMCGIYVPWLINVWDMNR